MLPTLEVKRSRALPHADPSSDIARLHYAIVEMVLALVGTQFNLPLYCIREAGTGGGSPKADFAQEFHAEDFYGEKMTAAASLFR